MSKIDDIYALHKSDEFINNPLLGLERGAKFSNNYNKPNVVRRFMSKAEYKQFKKNGFIFDAADSRGGISSTSVHVKAVNPDKIKKSTVALGADYYVDINVSSKNVFVKGKTKGGVLDYKIQDNIYIEDIIGSGRVKK